MQDGCDGRFGRAADEDKSNGRKGGEIALLLSFVAAVEMRYMHTSYLPNFHGSDRTMPSQHVLKC